LVLAIHEGLANREPPVQRHQRSGGHEPAASAFSGLYWPAQALVEEVAVTGIETTGADGISRELVLDEQRLDPRRTL
jgi:hypothetical protein